MPPQEQRNQLAVELDRLADSYDAVADLLLAESVHQNVLGNHERAAAALGALDRQGRPPRVEFVRTPRTGKSYTQRLLVLIGDEAYPPSWPAPVRDPRSQAEPRLNAWLARILGDPRRIRFTAAVAGAGHAPRAPVRGARAVTPLGGPRRPGPRARRAVGAGGAAAPGIPRCRPASAAAAAVTLLDEPPPGATRGSSGWARSARWPAGRTPWSRPTGRPPRATWPSPRTRSATGSTRPSSSTRADAVADAYATATARLEAAVSDASPDPQQLTDALWAAADLGVDGSVPRTMTDDGPASRRRPARPGAVGGEPA